MADIDNINAPAEENASADTKTRKTVRLRPAAPVNLVAQNEIADPLGGRDTDTSNLDILDDTQTRRTVKIKPLTPPAGSPVQIPGGPMDTNTRKTVVLRSGAAAPAIKLENSDAAPGSGENTNTRKTVVLRTPATPAIKLDQAPVAPAPAEKPAEVSDETVAVARPKEEEPKTPIAIPTPEISDDTVAVARPKEEPKAPVTLDESAEDTDDRTVKIKRPAAPPRIGPRPMGTPFKPGAAAAAPAAPAEETGDDAKVTVKLPPRPTPVRPGAIKPAAPVKPAPAAPAPAPAPAPAAPAPAAPAPAPAPAAPAPAPAKPAGGDDDELLLAPSKKEKIAAEAENTEAREEKGKPAKRPFEMNKPDADAPSKLYLVLGLITLILLLGTAVFTVSQYLDYDHQVDIYQYIPGLPHAK